ncbi:MAG: metal-dependent hydrolase [Deltaproteobacteria bacterium]|nr:metal-dependent hydrolase [Deltaproteobacteria bacterium]
MKIQRLSASTFRFTSPKGKVIILDPWLVGDPIWPLEERDPKRLAKTDILAITHGHFDHYSGVFEIVKANSEVVVLAVMELAFHLMAQGIKNVRPMGVGGTLDIDGVKFTTTTCAHSSSLLDPETGKSAWVGPPVGYLMQMEDGFKIYALGDTGLHSDMKLVGDYYRPDAALVPFSNAGFVMDAEQAAYAVNEFIRPRYVIPFHDFPFPKDAADPEAMEMFLKNFPSSYSSMGVAQHFLEIMEAYPDRKVCYLEIGKCVELP